VMRDGIFSVVWVGAIRDVVTGGLWWWCSEVVRMLDSSGRASIDRGGRTMFFFSLSVTQECKRQLTRVLYLLIDSFTPPWPHSKARAIGIAYSNPRHSVCQWEIIPQQWLR